MPAREALPADIVVVVHFIYVLAVVLPAALVPVGAWRGWRWVRSRKIRALHLSLMLVVVVESLFGVVCPLTRLERSLRGDTHEHQDFLATWVHRLMFYDFPTWAFSSAYVIFFAFLGALWFIVPPAKKARKR